jgi:hypothetical protein
MSVEITMANRETVEKLKPPSPLWTRWTEVRRVYTACPITAPDSQNVGVFADEGIRVVRRAQTDAGWLSEHDATWPMPTHHVLERSSIKLSQMVSRKVAMGLRSSSGRST